MGLSIERRIREAHLFLAAALGGGLDEPVDLELTANEQAYVDWALTGGIHTGEPIPEYDLLEDPARAPSVHATWWNPLRDTAADDPAMQRAPQALWRLRR